jgi:uncharacterized protein (TIGR03084 family)
VTESPDVYTDLVAAGEEVDQLVAPLDDDQWKLPTPAPGWTIAHQIAHLSSIFRLAGLAAAKPDAFRAMAAGLSADFSANVAAALKEYLAEPPPVLLARFRQERAFAEQSLAAVPDGTLVPWLVRPLPSPVLSAAGMLELFGHGQDVADALGAERKHGDRLRHIVAFGVRTWDFGYLARGLAVPDAALRFEITAPSGARWDFGPADSDQRISGPAEDFCLLVSRRRHPADLAVRATGDVALHWLTIAQAYRGPAGEGRQPGQFANRQPVQGGPGPA